MLLVLEKKTSPSTRLESLQFIFDSYSRCRVIVPIDVTNQNVLIKKGGISKQIASDTPGVVLPEHSYPKNSIVEMWQLKSEQHVFRGKEQFVIEPVAWSDINTCHKTI